MSFDVKLYPVLHEQVYDCPDTTLTCSQESAVSQERLPVEKKIYRLGHKTIYVGHHQGHTQKEQIG